MTVLRRQAGGSPPARFCSLLLLLLLTVLAGCSRGSGTKALSIDAPSSSAVPTTDAPASSIPTTAAAERSAPATGRSSGPTTTAAANRGGAAAPATGLAPPAAGVYRYGTAGTSTFGLTTVKYPPVSNLTVDPPSGTHQHWARDLRNASGNGPLFDFSLDFRPDGVYVEDVKLTTGFSGLTYGEDLRPPAPELLLATGAGPGAHRAFDVTSATSTAHVVLDVLRAERVTVGGRAVDTLVMHIVATLPAGDVTGTVDLTGWFAPSARVWVKERFVLDAATGGGLLKAHSAYDATLMRLP